MDALAIGKRHLGCLRSIHIPASMLLASLAMSTPAATVTVPPHYTLAWSDEFGVDGVPDPDRWDFDTAFNRSGWHNQELQYYSRERRKNARVESGRLIIEADKEDLSVGDWEDWSGQAYSSARLITRERQHFDKGFIEVRAKLPCGLGTWPAIWLLPARHGARWPEDGEIGIAEHVGFLPNRVYHSVQTASFNHLNKRQRNGFTRVNDACGRFHRYQLSWERDRIEIGVDDRPTFRLDRKSADEWPFDHPFYLILNVAVGGSWGGQNGVSDKAFPARMEVDYVRYYAPA